MISLNLYSRYDSIFSATADTHNDVFLYGKESRVVTYRNTEEEIDLYDGTVMHYRRLMSPGELIDGSMSLPLATWFIY